MAHYDPCTPIRWHHSYRQAELWSKPWPFHLLGLVRSSPVSKGSLYYATTAPDSFLPLFLDAPSRNAFLPLSAYSVQ